MSDSRIAIALPTNLDDLIDPGATFKPDALRAARDLARGKPWQGDTRRRLILIQGFVIRLCDAYGLPRYVVRHTGQQSGSSAASRVDTVQRHIVLSGRLSVVTVMHLFAKARIHHTRGELDRRGHIDAMRWSLNLFKRKFPISYGRCRLVDGMLVNDGRRDA